MQVKIRKITATAKVPTYGSDEAAGADLYADLQSPVMIAPYETEMIPTGVAIAVPKGCFGGIYARSGLASRQGLRPANAVGVVDSDYTGQVMVALHNDTASAKKVEPGERVAQLVIQPYVEADFTVVDALDETARGESGFGSTGTGM